MLTPLSGEETFNERENFAAVKSVSLWAKKAFRFFKYKVKQNQNSNHAWIIDKKVSFSHEQWKF